MNTTTGKHTEGRLRNSTSKVSDKVLFVIDDDTTILDVICSHLEICGFRSDNLHKFSSACEALEIIRFVQPNLIISDIHMPGISGDSLAKLIQWPEFKKSPVIAITGDSEFNIESTAGSFLNSVIYKPIDSLDLVNTVVETLNLAERQELAAETDRRQRTEEINLAIQNKEYSLREAFGKS